MTDMYLTPPYGKPGCAIIIPIFEIGNRQGHGRLFHP